MATGTIKFWNADKKTGWIESETKESVFLYYRGNWFSKGVIPEEGMKVEFEITAGGDDGKRKDAKNVKAIQSNQLAVHSQPETRNNDRTQEGNDPNPYQFIAVKTANAITDTPVWHDGKDSQTLLSGEMCFTLTALTPLLVGQWQYKAGKVDGGIESFFNQPVSDDKAILEPLRLPDGRVVLSGTSIKGMIRNSLSGLLSPPMERVAERSYSYRPNISIPSRRLNPIRLNFPAVIVGYSNEEIVVHLLRQANSVFFITETAENIIRAHIEKKGMSKNRLVSGVGNLKIRNAKIEYSQTNEFTESFYFFEYDGSIDGLGLLNSEFPEAKNERTYRCVLVPKSNYKPDKEPAVTIEELIVKHYLETLNHLKNTTNGLIMSGHPHLPEDKKAVISGIETIAERWEVEKRENLIGRLIYVELEGDKINSFGHHYYYRWRYANTIRTVWQSAEKSAVRAILAPFSVEKTTDVQGKPSCLTSARLLFGYTSREESDPLKQDGTANIGKSTYQRLAGRIYINSAVEAVNNGMNNERFLTGEKALALQPLGQPRPSSVEHYLQQPPTNEKLQHHRKDGGQMLTYGDLTTEKDTAGALAGRKFYLHQPNAATEKSCYQAEAGADYIQTQQAMLARFVSKPDTTFKFRLQFKDLRAWELGALLVTLEPNKHLKTVLDKLKNALPQQQNNLQALLDEINKHPTPSHKDSPLFAHKLGHARPLGFGSVNLKCEELKLLGVENGLPKMKMEQDNSQIENAITAFANKLAEVIKTSESVEFLKQWCAIHRYAGRTRAAYQKLNGETLKFHSQARTEHIKARRLPQEQGQLFGKLLKAPKFKI